MKYADERWRMRARDLARAFRVHVAEVRTNVGSVERFYADAVLIACL